MLGFQTEILKILLNLYLGEIGIHLTFILGNINKNKKTKKSHK